MSKRERNILQFTYDIEEFISEIIYETEHLSFEEFLKDRKTIGYIERLLEKIAEAITQIQKLDSTILEQVYPNKSYWENIKGMRNRIVHEYWGTSVEMLYEVSIFEVRDLLNYIYEVREKIEGNI